MTPHEERRAMTTRKADDVDVGAVQAPELPMTAQHAMALQTAMAFKGQPEHEKARAWRMAARLSRRELAQLTGYSESAIAAFEAGAWPGNKPIDPKAMHTYRLACAAVALGVSFDWGPATLDVRAARITVG
jgi:DNA-binding XRE family transcriptional regulator